MRFQSMCVAVLRRFGLEPRRAAANDQPGRAPPAASMEACRLAVLVIEPANEKQRDERLRVQKSTKYAHGRFLFLVFKYHYTGVCHGRREQRGKLRHVPRRPNLRAKIIAPNFHRQREILTAQTTNLLLKAPDLVRSIPPSSAM